ncbi:MAG: glycosyltransferase family 39 protein [Isosphaeraceae bacterium]
MTTTMEPGLSRSLREKGAPPTRLGLIAPLRVQPLIVPAPRSTMFFPLVVLVAVLPGLAALNSWDLTPPGPLWGLRALAVLDGLTVDQVPGASAIKPPGESAALREVSFQPPLYAWLAALGMTLSTDHDPLACVLPSYVAGVVAVVLVYLHGRIWRGGGMGLAAALLLGFNPTLLLRMQEATPTTLAVAGAVGALLCYGWHQRVETESVRSWPWAGTVFWAVAGGLSLGLSLLSQEGFGLIVIPIVLLHQVYLQAGSTGRLFSRPLGKAWRLDWGQRTALWEGLIALLIALLVALPWHLRMVQIYGWQALAGLDVRPWGSNGEEVSLLSRLLELAPITLPLGIFGAVRVARLAVIDENDTAETKGGSLWVIWLAVAALTPAFWPGGPRECIDLFLLFPLCLLAAVVVADLINRRVAVRGLILLAPATAMSVAWWASADLRGAVDGLWHGRTDAATALGLHLALDLVLASFWLTGRLDRWARRRDDRQRQVLACFLLAVLAITVGTGLQEVVFRHSETLDLLTLRTMILRRNRERPFEQLAVVGPIATPVSITSPAVSSPAGPRPPETYSGGWLRFILRTALPDLPQRDLGCIDELLALPEGQRLVIFTGPGERLSYAVKSKLGLEAIHPGRSGILDAYATAHDRPARK